MWPYNIDDKGVGAKFLTGRELWVSECLDHQVLSAKYCKRMAYGCLSKTKGVATEFGRGLSDPVSLNVITCFHPKLWLASGPVPGVSGHDAAHSSALVLIVDKSVRINL